MNGYYEVVSGVKIRKGKEPEIVEYKNQSGKVITNQVGFLETGTQDIKVYSVLTKKDNTTWGRLSPPDSTGSANWVCIQGLNRTYMKFIRPFEDEPDVSTDMLVIKHEREIERLKEWARTKGYTG